MILGKLICWATRKHKRGKQVALTDWERNEYGKLGQIVYRCPRCGAQWTRKVKAKP